VFLLGWLMVENGLGSETIEMCIGLFFFLGFSMVPFFRFFFSCIAIEFLFCFGLFLFLSCLLFSFLKWMTKTSSNTNHHL
jgi:hypothetical protein